MTGDKWAYTFDVVHAIPELVEHRGGNKSFVESLDAHFEGGHNEHSNEVRSPRLSGCLERGVLMREDLS
jgi:putative alpha-1,2-mannosidase